MDAKQWKAAVGKLADLAEEFKQIGDPLTAHALATVMLACAAPKTQAQLTTAFYMILHEFGDRLSKAVASQLLTSEPEQKAFTHPGSNAVN